MKTHVCVCPCCAGPGYVLGTLGRLVWYRCRDCGINFSRTPRPRRPKMNTPPAATVEARTEGT